MGRVEDYWDKLRRQRLQDIQEGMNALQANIFTQEDIKWLREITEACEKAKNGGGQNGCHN